MRSIRGRRILAIAAAITILGVFPGIAAAHVELVRAIPEGGSTATELVSVVSARYSEDLAAASSLQVLDADGTRVASGGVDPDDPRRMVARPDEPLFDGSFTVRATVVSVDGHVERTAWTFDVVVPPTEEPPTQAPPTPTASQPGSPSATTSPSPAATETPIPAPSADPGTPTSASGDVLLAIIAAISIVVVGAGFLLGRGRSRRT